MLRNIETPLPIYFCLWRRSSTYYGGEIFDPCPFSLDKRTQNTIISKYRPLASSVITFAEEVQNNDPPPPLPHFSFSIEDGGSNYYDRKPPWFFSLLFENWNVDPLTTPTRVGDFVAAKYWTFPLIVLSMVAWFMDNSRSGHRLIHTILGKAIYFA